MKSKERQALTPIELRKKVRNGRACGHVRRKYSLRSSLTPARRYHTCSAQAASFAKETVEKQSKSFQRYGIYGDFSNPYLTLQPEFEAAQIKVFGEMFEKGHLYRGRKPVHWSPSSRTALAEAELEYPPSHTSRSIYVAFPLDQPSSALSEYKDAKVRYRSVAISLRFAKPPF